MRVLFVCSGNNMDGPSPVVMSQGESLLNAGLFVKFFTVNEKGIKGYLRASLLLKQHLENNSYDLIHAHYGLSGITALLGNRSLPVVVSFMGDDILGSNNSDGRVKPISKYLLRINACLARNKFRHTILKSKEMQNNIRGGKSSIIPNGVDLDRFYPMDKKDARSKLGLSHEKNIILFVSNPARPEKNFNLVQKAMDEIEGARLISVFNKDHHQINQWMNAADCLVLSSFHEGSPNVIKEAMACNCPIVSTNVGDVQEVLGDIGGCYLASFDPVDFAGKIKSALDFAKVRGQTRGRERIRELGLDSETVAEKIVEVYRKVLN